MRLCSYFVPANIWLLAGLAARFQLERPSLPDPLRRCRRKKFGGNGMDEKVFEAELKSLTPEQLSAFIDLLLERQLLPPQGHHASPCGDPQRDHDTLQADRPPLERGRP